ncbi:bifunctional folylpolyglutamate synthase/dihydrofolate synthase [Hydrogenimonas sp. SS33]|uniref:bifunctional folylpolyglutamate synthase/dihydrofolate synthase n=1 Tax=Hydrogenimonas leucolamina TaxID=2954236 RepID=UPI00336BE165
MDLTHFLATKPLYYDKIDLERMPAAYDEVKEALDIGRVVHIVGTNGKGSTGRMLAAMLHAGGRRVGHYSSPHILRFNERVWIDGRDAEDAVLEAAHRKLQGLLRPETSEALSYFEYTTLLALVAFEGVEVTVLEAGLGGEFDATNVVEKALSVLTPVGLDHQAFLGDTVEEIALTKARSIDNKVLVAPQPNASVWEAVRRVAREKGAEVISVGEILEKGESGKIDAIIRKRGWPGYLGENAKTAAAAYRVLEGAQPPLDVLATLPLKGRFQRIAPNVVVDVGHNPLAAEALSRHLANAQAEEKPRLVYNALADKDVEAVLSKLAPFVEGVEIIPIGSERTMAPERLKAAIERCGLEAKPFNGIDAKRSYLVFGSFYVVEAFLKHLDTIP